MTMKVLHEAEAEQLLEAIKKADELLKGWLVRESQLLEAIRVMREGLELACEILHTPEHMQDDAWYENQKIVNDSLETADKILNPDGGK